MMNIQGLMKQAQMMQKKMQEEQQRQQEERARMESSAEYQRGKEIGNNLSEHLANNDWSSAKKDMEQFRDEIFGLFTPQ